MCNLTWLRNKTLVSIAKPSRIIHRLKNLVNSKSSVKSVGSESSAKLDGSESVGDAKDFSNCPVSRSCAKLSESIDFAKLDTHFHTVQLFELSSSAKPGCSKSSLYHDTFRTVRVRTAFSRNEQFDLDSLH